MRSHYTSEQIVDEVLSKQNNARDGKVMREVNPFLGGILYVVGFTEMQGNLSENFVIEKDGQLKIYRFPYELFHGISGEAERPSVILTMAQTIGVEAVITIILTSTICFLALKAAPIPEILGSALTAILGFYFGTKVASSKQSTKI